MGEKNVVNIKQTNLNLQIQRSTYVYVPLCICKSHSVQVENSLKQQHKASLMYINILKAKQNWRCEVAFVRCPVDNSSAPQ